MDVFMYQAALWCEDCGNAIRARLDTEGSAPEDSDDECSWDSDDYPKGPYTDGGGEADCPQHCDGCGAFLENDLTDDGRDYVLDLCLADRERGRLDSVALTQWAPFYDVPLPDEDED